MDAPMCRLCHTRHWGACDNSPSVKALGAAVKAVPAKKPDKAKEPKAKPRKTKAKGKAKAKKKPKAKPAVQIEPTRRGRPLAAEAYKSAEHTRPWETLKMSRRTYYRRKAAGTLIE